MTSSKELSKLLKEITILYVEDEKEARENISEILSKFSDNVLLATNGDEALKIFNEKSVQLVVTDIEMPVMNGIKLIEKIRKDDVITPVIMLTAFASSDYLLKCANLNIQSYIVKPIEYKTLKEALYKVTEYLNLTSNLYLHISQELSYDKINGVLINHETQEIHLNKKEKALMNLLVEHKNKLVTYSQIEHAVWNDYDDVMTESALRTVIKNLRKKSDIKFIDNVAGLGYKIHIFK
ncbi:MAG: response regulator transcription factor [Campylobacterota bacterium]|nr:response regulator transcription factor [Campylobacterota bacterium]